MKTIKKEVKIDINLNIDEVYESLTYDEKQDLFEEIYNDDVISVTHIINMLSSYDDAEMREYYRNNIKEIFDIGEIKTMFDEGTFNNDLISLIDKEYMTTNKEILDYKLIDSPVKDPIVLQPVLYKEKRYFLIITAWGEEAGDENIVNQNFN